jgi:alpha-1,2-mannosyltransferase
VALGVCAYQLSLPHVLLGYHYSTGNPYDDGVYLGAALRLVNGVFPYRDFVLLHPPGIALLMTPIAALGRVIGTRDAMAGARLVTVLVTALNAVLAAIAVRRGGVGAMMIAGTALACFPLAVAADQSLLLEPYLVCFCLIGLIAMFSGGELASSHRLALAGVAFGFAGAIKIWAIFPILVAFAVCLPRWKDLRTLVFGTMAGFIVPSLPFFLFAPHAFIHDVFVTQLAHTGSGTTGAGSSVRLLTLTGFWGISFLHSKTALALCFAILLVIFVALVYGWSVRSNTRADWFILGSAVVTTAVMFLPSSYFDHYAYFPAAFVALLIGSCASRAGLWVPWTSGSSAAWVTWSCPP